MYKRALDIKKIKTSKKQVIVIIILIVLALGIIVGALIANNLDTLKKDELYTFTSKLIFNINSLEINKATVLADCFIKYGKFVIIIWLLAFIPYGSIFSLLIIFTKGLSYGFTTSFLVSSYGVKGIYYAIQMYFIQNLFMIPTYFFVAYFCINYSMSQKEKINFNKTNNNILEYVIVLIISCACVFLVSLIEAFVLPNIINNIVI